ncbi:hypothetical protein [Guptibacillus algicola]|uniref:hypothetical protein n=1 Tax=Guptibacillus algicola TaxID=225844 RepID=UPI001CD6BD7B|nr:hypothetical protein [Alkalihalobacillus algicola]MCA0987015.1 hypothetical protein [Alkalihalobacillus algicola]
MKKLIYTVAITSTIFGGTLLGGAQDTQASATSSSTIIVKPAADELYPDPTPPIPFPFDELYPDPLPALDELYPDPIIIELP